MRSRRYLIDGLILLALIAILFYVIVRTALFFFAEYTSIEKVFAVMLISGELFVLLHALGYVFNIFKVFKKESVVFEKNPEKENESGPSVAILVAARHEPAQVLKNTFITINALNYKNKRVYLLDDSSLDKYKKEADELAEEFELKLFRREARRGAKAGIINDCLKTLDQKYIVVFDADQNPMPDFLNVLIHILEQDAKLAFVQTPQFYSNTKESSVSKGAAFQQAVFYEYICEGKNTDNAMFCCGTNIVFRRDALVDAGGLDESTVTEDFATSVKLHSLGWKSLYYPHVSVFGMGPIDLNGYFKQQFRWAAGTISVFKKLIWRFFTKPFSLRAMQWWEYLLSSSYYLVGLAFFFLMICPIIYLLFRVPSFFAKPEIYFLAFMPYITLSITIFYMVLKTRHYKIKDLFLGQLLGVLTFSVYIRGAISALLGLKITFGITEKIRGRRLSYLKLWPQTGMLYFSLIALIWGINRFVYERNIAILVNGFWVLYNFLILSSLFYFNREKR